MQTEAMRRACDARDFSYKLPFAFTGKIEQVNIKLGPVEAGAAPA